MTGARRQQFAGRAASGASLPFVLLACWAGAALGCREGGDSVDDRRSWARVRTSGGQPAALAALMMPYGAIRAGLGPHRVKLRSRLERQVPKLGKTVVEQTVDIKVDGAGGFAARKKTHKQYGAEVIWTGRKLYSRLRYGRFLERDPNDPDEPKRLAERMYGLLSAYLRLLEPFVEVKPGKRGKRAKRDAERVLLSLLDDVEEQIEAQGKARSWRRTVTVESLEGAAWLDEQSGAPLKVSLEAKWSYTLPAGPPPETGIPEENSAGDRGTMRLRFEQTIDRVGSIKPIAAPPDRRTVADPRRPRLEIERQMVTGERPMRADWGKLSTD